MPYKHEINKSELRYFCSRYFIVLRKLLVNLPILFAAVLLVMHHGMAGQQLDAPEITCTTIDNSGDITIQWNQVADPLGQFTQYEIRGSQFAAGPFTTLGVVTGVTNTSFLYSTGVAPPVSPSYFIVFAQSSDGALSYLSDPSTTAGAIFLTATPSTNPLGYASLSWNSPYPPNSPTPPGIQYEVWIQRGGVWSLLETLPYGATSLNYEIMEICDEVLGFQIRLTHPSGCIFQSNVPSAVYRDIIAPDIPSIRSISIDPVTSDAIVTWDSSYAPDTKGYLLYKCQGGGASTTTLIGTLMGAQNTQYLDMVSNTTLGQVHYAVAAFDSCFLLSPPMVPASPIGNCSSSIFLENPSYTNCDNFIRLQWQPYEGWTHGVDSYTIYHGFSTSSPGSGVTISYSIVGTVVGSATTFTHHGIPQQSGYNYYYIEGRESQTGNKATSNVRSVHISYPTAPSYVYLGSASVLTNSDTQITVDCSPNPFPHNFLLQRYGIHSNEWKDIDVESVVNTPQVSFLDKGLSNDVFSYTYRVIVTNGCGAVIDTTNFGKTILVDGAANLNLFVNIITWGDYGEWNNGVSSYRIYREIDDNGVIEMIAEINSTSNHYYEDDVSELLFTKGKFCYWVEAVETPTSPSGVDHTASSNVVCLNQEPVIWIPNTFVRGGHNNTFRPVISFADFDTYRMTIFSRWGDVVFDTYNFDEPWNGSFHDKVAPQGTYTYLITIKDGFGRLIEKRGTVNLIVRKTNP